MSNYTDRFQALMENYVEELEKADRNRKPGSGLFGFGRGPGDDPCHEEMDRQVGELAAEAAEASPEETAELVRAILRAEGSLPWRESARLAVLAAQRHTLGLISRMEAENRRETADWYEKTYPKRVRLPIQKQIIRELRK